MPYLDASPADLQRSFGLADADLPDAAVLAGVLSTRRYQERLHDLWPAAREVEERITLVEVAGRQIWFVVAFGAALAATFTHLAVKLGARAVLQLGTVGGLQAGLHVGDVLVPTIVVGRDGVSRQLSRNQPIGTDAVLTETFMRHLAAAGVSALSGTLVTTTTIAFERPMDIARWRRAGFAAVEMEAAATLAVAHHFGVPATGAFVVLDNLAADHTVFALSEADRERVAAARLHLDVAALAALAETVTA